MVRLPGSHAPNIKNRSSKNLYFLTGRGINSMNSWHKSLGIKVHTTPPPKKENKKTTEEK